MTTIQLTPAQHAILAYAIEHTGGKIEWFPDNLKGGARAKVLEGLFNRALITPDGDGWMVAAEGYDALGRARPTSATIHPDPKVEAAVSAVEANLAQEKDVDGKRRTSDIAKLERAIEAARQTLDEARDRMSAEDRAIAEAKIGTMLRRLRQMRIDAVRPNSKIARMLELLCQPQGATIAQLCEATGWKAHSVRGTFANVFKKKLGLTISSDKPKGGERIYKIV